MSADTLTSLDYATDRRRFVVGTPVMQAGRSFINQALGRSMSSAGLVLARRIVMALLIGSESLRPAAGAPLAHHAVFATFRRAAHLALLALISLSPNGDDSPILSSEAGAALITIETADPLVAADPALADALRVMLAGCGWRLE